MAGLLLTTNLPAPYRVPVWRELAKHCDLRVAVLAKNESNRRWSPDLMGSLSYTVLKTAQISRGEATFYALIGLDWLRELRRADSVILPGWENPAAWQMLVAGKLLRKRVIGFYESTMQTWGHQKGIIAFARQCFFRQLDSVLTVGSASTNAVRALGLSDNKIVETINTVDSEIIAAIAEKERTTNPQTGPGHRYVYVGQLIERKNVATLIKAFARIADKDDTLAIFGEGPLLDELQRVANESGAADQISFNGYVAPDQLPARIASQHTLVLPSTEEVWGLVVNEALACGLNVVVSNRCGVAPEVALLDGVMICGVSEDSIANALRTAPAKSHDHEARCLLSSPAEAAQALFEIAVTQSEPLPKARRS